jgi:parallel beta-helix repeat protein
VKGRHCAVVVTWGLLALISAGFSFAVGQSAAAQTLVRYVANTGMDSGGCTEPSIPCRTVQYAVDAASSGDVVKVAAGLYTDVNDQGGPFQVQVVYIDKTVTIRGGYTTTNGFGGPPHPDANPTTLDARLQGRAIYVTGDISPTIEGFHITGGGAIGLGGGLWGEDAGGGVYIEQSSATLSNNTIFENRAYSGGGLYLWNSDATLSSNVISDNLSYGSGPLPAGGGGLYLLEGGVKLEGNALTANRALDSGGAIKLFNSDATTLTGNTFVANVANLGGGLYLHSSDAFVEGNAIISNSATSSGGGLYISSGSTAPIARNTIISNSASSGGGLYLSGNDASLTGNTFRANSAGDGGGLYLAGSDASVDENLIVSNLANRGGGLYLSESNASLHRNIVQANSADYGAGLALSLSNATLANTLVIGNLGGVGSGLYVQGSSPRLLHTTISGGSGINSGVWISAVKETDFYFPSTVWLTNTILVSHTVGITVVERNTVTLAATLWGTDTWANDTDWGGDGIIATGTANIWGDPGFVDSNSGDYHIGSGSAALDQGLDEGIHSDIDHQPRPYLDPDLGSDEYWPPGVLKYTFLPLVLR